MDLKIVRGFVFLSVFTVGSLIIPGLLYADDCDQAFKDLEVYYCKVGRVEHKIGLKIDTRPQCIEHRKLAVTGCTVETISTEPDTKYLYIVGPEKNRKNFNDFVFQCDNNAANNFGGMDKSRFEGYMAPGYTLDKFPSETNQARSERFLKDLAKQGKTMFGGIIVSKPYVNKFETQMCQYFNVKTNKVALKFNCNVTTKAEGKTSAPAEIPQQQPSNTSETMEKSSKSKTSAPVEKPQQQPEGKDNASGAIEKGFKGMFGR